MGGWRMARCRFWATAPCVICMRSSIASSAICIPNSRRGPRICPWCRRPGFRYSIRDIFEVRPTMAERDGPVARSTAAAIRRVIGRHPEFICSPGTYDQKHIDRVGKLRDCIAYGPGILDLAHQPDEYVVIEDIVNSP